MTLPRFTALRGAFASRNYAIYASGNLVSMLGTWVQRVAVGWLAWDLSHSGFWLGMVAFADLAPVFVVGLFAGVLADRYDRRLLLMGCQFTAAVLSAVVGLFTATGLITIEVLFALTLVGGCLFSLAQPSRLSLIHGLVAPQNLAAAIATNSISFNIARFIGPAIAGPIIVHFNVAMAFGVNALSFLVMTISLFFVRLPRHEGPQRTASGVLSEMAEGIRYALGSRVVLPLLGLSISLSLLVRPAFELLPGFADVVFQRGAAGLSTLNSAAGLGAILGGLWIAQALETRRLSTSLFVAAILSGMGVVLFALTTNFYVGVGAMVAVGSTVVICGICIQTLLQHSVDGAVRGRVVGIWGIIFRGGPGIGTLIMGSSVTAFGIGIGLPLLVGAVLSIAVVGAIALRNRDLEVAVAEAKQAVDEPA